jgi:predicted Zn-dependent protease
MRVVVAVIALAAAGVVAGVVYATREAPSQPRARCKGAVGAVIVPGVPSRNIAAVRTALAKPAGRAARAIEPLADEQPKDAVVQFNYGWALFCGGFDADAVPVLARAKRLGRDSRYAVVADNILHPQYFQKGYPLFEYAGRDPLLIQGQIAQRNYHQQTAERLWARAATLHPNDPQAQVAAAVGRFDMDDLSASFSRLGPLVKRFPQSQSVRYHLGLLLAWTGQGTLALKEFRAAGALDPTTTFGKEAIAFVKRLESSGTKGPKR